MKIVITDPNGQKIRTFYGPAKAGFNQAVWDLNYDEATRLELTPVDPEMEALIAQFRGGGGAPAVPGTYKVAVTVNGKTQEQGFTFDPDPRLNIPIENFRAQTRAALEARDQLSAINTALNRLESLHTQILTVQRVLGSDQSEGVANAAYQPVLQRARELDRKLRGIKDEVYNSDLQPGGDDSIHYLRRFHDRVQGLAGVVSFGYGQAPNELAQEEMTEVRKQLTAFLQKFNEVVKGDVSDFNKLAFDKGANTLFAGGPVELKAADTAAGAQDK